MTNLPPPNLEIPRNDVDPLAEDLSLSREEAEKLIYQLVLDIKAIELKKKDFNKACNEELKRLKAEVKEILIKAEGRTVVTDQDGGTQ